MKVEHGRAHNALKKHVTENNTLITHIIILIAPEVHLKYAIFQYFNGKVKLNCFFLH